MSIWSRISEAISALAKGEGLGTVFDRLRVAPQRSVAFTIAVIALGAKMAKADGQVTKDEVLAFRRVFTIPKSEEGSAARVFNLARQDVAGFDAYARKIRAMFGPNDRDVMIDLMEGLFHIAMADGEFHPAEEDFLREVARIFGLDDRCFRSLRARFVADDPYAVLGIAPDFPPDVIKKAWREAVKSSHPDVMIARGVPPEALKLAEDRMRALNAAYEENLAARRMIRLATYNVEWMNALFDDAGHLQTTAELSARYNITKTEQLTALGIVFTAMNADGVMIIEAPDQGSRRSTVRALETFAAHFSLRTRKAVIGFASDTEQEIAFLYDPDVLTVAHDPRGPPAPAKGAPLGPLGAPRFDTGLRHDINADGVEELVVFSKPPLELAITAGDRTLHLIGVHAKSKAPHGIVNKQEYRRISIVNRRKQLAECHWLRARADEHLALHESLIVMGDFNDGPGLDKYERLFGQSGVEVVLGLGTPRPNRLYDPHAFLALNQRAGLSPTTARFWLPPQKCYFEALLDYIMVSADLYETHPTWRIWHPFNDPRITAVPELSAAILTASDHFPVTIDL